MKKTIIIMISNFVHFAFFLTSFIISINFLGIEFHSSPNLNPGQQFFYFIIWNAGLIAAMGIITLICVLIIFVVKKSPPKHAPSKDKDVRLFVGQLTLGFAFFCLLPVMFFFYIYLIKLGFNEFVHSFWIFLFVGILANIIGGAIFTALVKIELNPAKKKEYKYALICIGLILLIGIPALLLIINQIIT